MRQNTIIGAILLLTACGRDTITTPAPRISFSLSGSVNDTAFRPVGQAKIEVLDGPQAGAVTLTDDAGKFRFAETFTAELTLRASKAGYLEKSDHITNVIGTSQRNIGLSLESATPPTNLAGNYLMTFSADAACTSLPPVARSRTYSAVIVGEASGGGTRFQGRLGGASFAPPGPSLTRYDSFFVAVFRDFARLLFDDPSFGTAIVEQLGPEMYVGIMGTAEGLITPSTSELPVSGRFEFCDKKADAPFVQCSIIAIVCDPSNHHLTLTRQ